MMTPEEPLGHPLAFERAQPSGEVTRRRARRPASARSQHSSTTGRVGDGFSAALADVIEAAADAFVVVDAAGRILEWNHQAEALFGYRRAEVLGQELTLTDASSGALQALPQISAGGGVMHSRRVAMPAVNRHGQSIPVELTLWPARWGDSHCFGGVFRILDQPQTEHMSCSVGSIVESSDSAILSHDLDGRIITWNRAAEEMFGFTAREALGQLSSLIVPEELADEFDTLVAGAFNGEAIGNHETVGLRKDGTRLDLAVTISPVRDMAGRAMGVSTIARDITERKRMAAALAVALAEAQAAEAITRQFLADAAHQLRNPLAGLRASADSLLRSTSPATQEKLLAHVIDDVSRAGRLIDQLLRIARLDRGELPTPVPTDPVALCQEEVERARLLAPGLRWAVVNGPDIERLLLLDGLVVRELLGNLLDNARRYARRRIEVSLHRLPGRLVLRVTDDGPGLASTMVDQAFERFTTLDTKSGSGLGLPIARDLARSHGGDLAYEGGVFVVTLPALAAELALSQ